MIFNLMRYTVSALTTSWNSIVWGSVVASLVNPQPAELYDPQDDNVKHAITIAIVPIFFMLFVLLV